MDDLGNKMAIKALSVNKCWKGRRFKTDIYKGYEKHLSLILNRKINLPDGKLRLTAIFGFSNSGSDLDNPLKPFIDILQARYLFNDSRIYHLDITKVDVKTGQDFIDFKLESFEGKPRR